MRIVCLINGGDGMLAYYLTKQKYHTAEVFPVWYDLGLPYSKHFGENMPSFVRKERITDYPRIVNANMENGVPEIEYPYELMIWQSASKYRADMIVFGHLVGDYPNQMNHMNWVSDFASKHRSFTVSFPLIEDSYSKSEVMAIAKAMRWPHVHSMLTCHYEKSISDGCGNCSQCIRKKSALASIAKPNHIPRITRFHKRVKDSFIQCSASMLEGKANERAIRHCEEMTTDIVKLFGDHDIHKLAKKIRRHKG